MKRFTTKSLVLAAAFAAVAVGASAQTLSAEIPFNFRMGDAAMAPGAYQFNIGYGSSGVARIQMTSIETKKSVLVLPQSRRDAAKAWIAAGVPKLAFSCAEGNCALTTVWTGTDSTALVLAAPRRKNHDTAEIRVVTLNGVKAE